jgi:acetoin utilization deacetylase AcuC-like enzyme
MGFCFFNNIAVAAAHALAAHKLSRVAVVDFDVHHGNGTEDCFKGDQRVLMVSTFQHPFYPYSGTENARLPTCSTCRSAGIPTARSSGMW